MSQKSHIRGVLDGLQRISDSDVHLHDHHYLVLSRLNRWIFESGVSSASGRLLDYGCGARPYEKWFRDKVSDYIGADVAVAQGAQVDVIITPGESLPLESASFNTVLSTQTLEHVPDPLFYVRECSRMLAPSGHLVLTAPMTWRHHEEPYDFFRFTEFGLRRLLDEAGLKVEDCKPCGGLFATLGQTLLDSLASRGVRRPTVNRIVNTLCDRLEKWCPDTGITLCWMIIARKP